MFGRSVVKTSTSLGLMLAISLVTASCGAVQDLAEEQTGETISIDSPDFTAPDFEVPDFNAPDFTVPDIVAPDIDVDIIEAPELPDIRFPDAIEIEVPEISSPDVAVEETEDETIYTVKGQVLFEFDQAEMRPDTLSVLDEILDAIENRDFNGEVEIAGHTDAKGTADYNYDLSVRRATGVALWFRERLPEDRSVVAVGYGEGQPIAANTLPDGSDDPDGRARNRRVEVIVSK